MPKLTSGRYADMPRTVGHDQTMGLANGQRRTALRIAAAKAEERPVSERIAALVARSDGTPALTHRRRDVGDTFVATTDERKARAARGRQLMLAATS